MYKKHICWVAILICLATTYCFSSDNYDPNTLRLSANNSTVPSGTAEDGIWAKVLSSKFDILFVFILGLISTLFGFILGLIGTCFIDYRHRVRKKKEFREGVLAELKQNLFILSTHTLNCDASISAEKVECWLGLNKEFNFFQLTAPLDDDTSYSQMIQLFQNNQTIQAFVEAHKSSRIKRQQESTYQSIAKLRYDFLQNNIHLIPLLKEKERALLLNIFRQLNIINEQIDRNKFYFEKSYDGSLDTDNRARLRTNYFGSCQAISEWSFKVSKEIAHYLKRSR
jgi:hypothetical protein